MLRLVVEFAYYLALAQMPPIRPSSTRICSIMGGLLLLGVTGPGKYSVDGK